MPQILLDFTPTWYDPRATAFQFTVTDGVPWPLTITAPVGTLQVYDVTSGSGVTENTLAASDLQTSIPVHPVAAATTIAPDDRLHPLTSVTVT